MTNESDKPRLTPEDQAFLEKVVEPLKNAEMPSQGVIFFGGGLTPISPNPDLTEEAKKTLQEQKRNIRQHRS
ncbi:MAG: hypothetical protein Q7R53_01200 [bacterium]|nr:hypothetical protein [bacterium]